MARKGPLVKVSEAERLTGLTRYKLLGLARAGHLRLKELPAVNGKPGRPSLYLLREDLERLTEAPEHREDIEEQRRRRRESRARGERIRAILGR